MGLKKGVADGEKNIVPFVGKTEKGFKVPDHRLRCKVKNPRCRPRDCTPQFNYKFVELRLNRHRRFNDRQDHFEPLDSGYRVGNIGRHYDDLAGINGHLFSVNINRGLPI